MSPIIKKRWLLVTPVGSAPFTKTPAQSHAGVIAMLEEIEASQLYLGAEITLIELTHDDELWASSGREVLAITRMLGGGPPTEKVRDKTPNAGLKQTLAEVEAGTGITRYPSLDALREEFK